PVFAGAGVVGGVLAFRVLTKARPGLPLGMAIALAGAYTATGFAAFASTRVLWPVAVPVLVVIFAAAAAMMLRWSWGAPPQESGKGDAPRVGDSPSAASGVTRGRFATAAAGGHRLGSQRQCVVAIDTRRTPAA